MMVPVALIQADVYSYLASYSFHGLFGDGGSGKYCICWGHMLPDYQLNLTGYPIGFRMII